MNKSKYKVLILGAGAGGLSVAAKLKRQLDDNDIAIVDPSDKHYYQPLWTVAGTGLIDKVETEKFQKDLMPDGVDWIKESVEKIDPINQVVYLSHQV